MVKLVVDKVSVILSLIKNKLLLQKKTEWFHLEKSNFKLLVLLHLKIGQSISSSYKIQIHIINSCNLFFAIEIIVPFLL